ncbi:MAG: hypothetical protein ACRDH5_15185, partial [bacterium]
TVLLRRMREGFAMGDILLLIGVMGLVFIACWAVSLSFRDPTKETDGEKRRREKREKKEASKPK